jgi:hypothetical protein
MADAVGREKLIEYGKLLVRNECGSRIEMSFIHIELLKNLISFTPL